MKNILLTALTASAIAAAPVMADEAVRSGTVCTRDGVAIAYDHYMRGSDTVIIICPGFYNSKSNRWMQKAVEIVRPAYDVIIFDFRGHGKSGGTYTWSAKEEADLDAILDYAHGRGYKHIGIIGFSLGAAVAVNTAASRGGIESMVLISCPSSFSMINFHFWEPGMFSDLMDNIDCKWDGKGARVANIFMHKDDPKKTIGRVKDTPILFIHGDKDWIVKDSHSRRLYEAAGEPKKLEIIPGGLHAERLIQAAPDKMQELIRDWFLKTLKRKDIS